MNFRKKLTDYITGVAVVGAVSLTSLIMHVIIPKAGHSGQAATYLFSSEFWIIWTTLMLGFALFYALWVFFLYSYDGAGRSRSR